MGQSLISFKGDGWRGRTTLQTNDRGEKRLVRILNGYVSSDGSEIRSFPGWRTLIDLSQENNPNGWYGRYIIDAMRPVLQPPSPLEFYTDEYKGGTSIQQTLYAKAHPIWLEAFEQVGDTINIMGTTRFREVPLMDSSRNILTPVSISTETHGSGFRVVVTMSGSVGSATTQDSTGAGLNGIDLSYALYAEGFAVADASVTATLDSFFNGKVWELSGISGANITLFCDIGNLNTGSPHTLTAGSLHMVRANRSGVYPTPEGVDPFDADTDNRIDDWNALTNWRIIPTLDLKLTNAAYHVCHPAWVANRQRDFGDGNDNVFVSGTQGSHFCEGLPPLSGLYRYGVSRREQKELPYRIVPEPAGDRIIIAAPGYNCLFQIPLAIPFNPNEFPATPASDITLGIPWFGNDIYDKPRALGVPKCRLIDSVMTPLPPSPGLSDVDGYSHLALCVNSSPSYGFPSGTYRMCATYQDDVTGEEGEPSEVIEFTVPANDYAYYVRVHYFHPGYIMPECLALRLNVYLSVADGDAMGFYKSFDLKSYRAHASLQHLGYAYDGTSGTCWLSAKYGFQGAVSPADFQYTSEWRTLHLPLPTRSVETSPGTGDFDLGIDFTRPPVASGMPRGASCARFIRGVMVAVGHVGNAGPNKVLYRQYGSLILDSGSTTTNVENNQILTRIHEGNDFVTFFDGEQTDGFGVAGRAFPDSCQGISGISNDLIPRGFSRLFQIDKVLNRKCTVLDQTGYTVVAREVLQLTKPIVDRDFAVSPTDPDTIPISLSQKTYYLRMFKGQIQVSDPGEPSKVVKAADIGIKLIDPNKDDDGISVFQLAGNAIICTRKETYFFSWARSAGAEIPTTISTEYGCIAPNSMVEFDGGVAWLSERGPVALGASLQFVGADIQQDFVGSRKRYLTDGEGMMRHAWSCHDSARGLVMWGLITETTAHTVPDGVGGESVAPLATDGALSRMACDEVLIWSYRSNSFSTWRPPSGLEVLWMRQIVTRHPINENSSTLSVAFLARDGRIYTLDDTWNDCNDGCMQTTATASGTMATSMALSSSLWKTDGVANGGDVARSASSVAGSSYQNFLVRPGQIVQAFNSHNEIEWETTVESADPATNTIVLSEAKSWSKGQSIRIGAKPAMVIETTFVGGETATTIEAKAVQFRFNLHGNTLQSARTNATVQVRKADGFTDENATEVSFGEQYMNFGLSNDTRHGRRITAKGSATAPEMAVKVTISSEAQVRIADIALEV